MIHRQKDLATYHESAAEKIHSEARVSDTSHALRAVADNLKDSIVRSASRASLGIGCCLTMSTAAVSPCIPSQNEHDKHLKLGGIALVMELRESHACSKRVLMHRVSGRVSAQVHRTAGAWKRAGGRLKRDVGGTNTQVQQCVLYS
jgi:hypothetical protein